MNTTTEQNPFVAPQAAVDDVYTGADSVFKLNLFSAQGRIGRVRYLGYSMAIGLLIILGGVVLSVMTTMVAMVAVYAALFYMNIMLAIKRSHDFNVNGWLSLLIFVPFLNLLFLFVPGTDGPNRFGNKTAPNGNSGWIVVAIVVGIAVIGILAAIAIPAYQGYVQRAHAVQTP